MDGIQTRESILLSSPASVGYTGRPGDTVVWEGQGELVLTPSTLYFVHAGGTLGGSRSLAISYAAITEAGTGSVRHWRNPPFGSPTQLNHMLLVRPLDGAIRTKGDNSGATRHQFVFNLIDPSQARPLAADQRMVTNTNRATAERAASLISAQSRKVDAFGRTDHGRGVWLAIRVRPTEARVAQALHTALATGSETPPDSMMATRFAQASLAALRQEVPEFSFRPLGHGGIRWDLMEYGITPVEDLSRDRGGLDRLLVLEVSSITFRAVPGSDRIEASYKFLADFFDLDPAKPGMHFWDTHRVTRTRREWTEGGPSLLGTDLSQAARPLAAKVRARR